MSYGEKSACYGMQELHDTTRAMEGSIRGVKILLEGHNVCSGHPFEGYVTIDAVNRERERL